MSFFKNGKIRGMTALSLSLGLTLAAGCTVKPLYGDNAMSSSNFAGAENNAGLRAQLASIAIDEPRDRFSQIVRNRLIYLLAGGAGEPASPRYKLSLNAGYIVQQAVRVNIGDNTEREGRASSGTVIASADYVLREPGDKGKEVIVQRRKRSVTSSFDRPRQEYANLQAEEDAKKRAAQELAESIYLSLAQTMASKQ
ncbi:LPS assembly lipoprotein LptE [Candidatus Tokpelaia sp.]|uniref:LPS assembly lipoprotein LptE n=1 Tax=Candidatus Tokpelaia sp. TaxID=2233777 RepID=UPI0012399B37|nr:LPS assembly lipoprotein LptE [Candidatus Tokpelaia sp.]KAA6406068.1 hypothetical protein DPQ22_01100 [Candidatus Tokpelaia sp.]